MSFTHARTRALFYVRAGARVRGGRELGYLWCHLSGEQEKKRRQKEEEEEKEQKESLCFRFHESFPFNFPFLSMSSISYQSLRFCGVSQHLLH